MYGLKKFKPHNSSEPYYLTCMRYCLAQNIKIYPVCDGDNYAYKIEINDNGHILTYQERIKSKARFKKDKIWYNEIYKLYTIIARIMSDEQKKNILEQVSEIIYNRDSEKAKDYGPFHDSMKDAAKIMSILTGKHITTLDFYKGMMALKLARLRHSDKHDTYLDLLAYIASASELITKQPIDD